MAEADTTGTAVPLQSVNFNEFDRHSICDHPVGRGVPDVHLLGHSILLRTRHRITRPTATGRKNEKKFTLSDTVSTRILKSARSRESLVIGAQATQRGADATWR